MDRKHALWLERGVALGNFFMKLWRLRPSPEAVRPAMDLPADARDAARYSAEIALAMRNGRQIRSETLGFAVRRTSRFFGRRIGTLRRSDAEVVRLPEPVRLPERRTGTR